MKKKGMLIGFTVIATVAVIAAFLAGSPGSGREMAADFTVEKVVRRDLHATVLATGIVRPCIGAEVKVGSRVSGIVQHLHADIGDPVEKGRILAELDPTENRARYNQAAAALEVARADLRYARLNLDRQRSLFKEDTVSMDTLDAAEKTFEMTKAQVNQAEANG